jgi:hypothetical protein
MVAVTLECFVKEFPRNHGFRHASPRPDWRRWLCAVIAVGVLILAGATQLQSQATNQAQPATTPSKPASKSSASAASKIAAIKSFRIVQEKDGQAVEILSTKPLVPEIQAITDPDRLVIDLPNARLDTPQKRIAVQADQISTIRADQFQQNPPTARVVVDLQAPRAFTWDAAGNRLVVHLGKSPGQTQAKTPFEKSGVPSLTSSPAPAISVVRADGPLALAGNNGNAASSVTAGPDTAILRLSSGGEVHVCPGTTLSVTPSQNQHNVMFGLNTGAMEAHFGLDASSDTVMTPDFRIQLVGPGQFHYAISADNQGNTCVRALPGNTASAIVSELIGDRTYQVKATDQLVFRSGQLDRVDMSVPLECGCPPPHDAPLRATTNLPVQSEGRDASRLPASANASSTAGSSTAASPHADGATGAAPASAPTAPPDTAPTPNELHVQVEAPFVFHASGPPPAPVADVNTLPPDSRLRTASVPSSVAALPPPASGSLKADAAAAKPEPPRGFFRRIGGFFAALFH